LVNAQRTSRGLRALRFHTCTDRRAERWTRHLAKTNSLRHQSMGSVLRACRATYAGETLAKGRVGPRRVVRLWMHSSGHRAILLSKYPRRVGIGAVTDSAGRWVVTANFTRL
jgi:uncharacterized protein YkwD